MKLFVGIDPGTIRMGVCVMSEEKILHRGTIKLSARNTEVLDRVIAMAYQMRELLTKFKRAEQVYVAIEDQYVGKNVKGTINLARLVGALIFVSFDVLGVVPILFSPSKLHLLGDAPRDMRIGELAMKLAKDLFRIQCQTEDEAVAVCMAELCRRYVLAPGQQLLDADETGDGVQEVEE